MTAAACTVSGLWVYPVKGCRGIQVPAAAVMPTGLQYDRCWMVVRSDTGKFVTQRQIPKLCQVSTELPQDALLGRPAQPGAALVLAAPGMPAALQVPLTDGAASRGAEASQIRQVTVWEWTGAAVDEGQEAATWLSTYLGQTVRLVRHIGGAAPALAGGQPTVRPTDPEFSPGHEVKFADGFPVLVARQENLEALNAQLSAAGEPALPMDRFRPNIVLSGGGAAPWADDSWGGISIGTSSAADGGGVTKLANVKPCSRCKVTTINQATAEVGSEPLATLGSFRTGKALGWAERQRSWTHAVFFGWNAAVLQPGTIAVGDAVRVAADAAAL